MSGVGDGSGVRMRAKERSWARCPQRPNEVDQTSEYSNEYSSERIYGSVKRGTIEVRQRDGGLMKEKADWEQLNAARLTKVYAVRFTR